VNFARRGTARGISSRAHPSVSRLYSNVGGRETKRERQRERERERERERDIFPSPCPKILSSVSVAIGHARVALFGEEDRGSSGIKSGVTAKTAKVRRYISTCEGKCLVCEHSSDIPRPFLGLTGKKRRSGSNATDNNLSSWPLNHFLRP